MNRKDDQAGSHCPFRDRDEPLTRQALSADEISVLECMALMAEEDRAAFIRMAQGIADASTSMPATAATAMNSFAGKMLLNQHP
ncbi:hypothetical protein ACM7HG_30555 [Pseudomonas aeruginosa]